MTSAAPVRAFPWDRAMRAGLGLLRLSPDQFWSMTPRELAAAIAGLTGLSETDIPILRSGLADLMSRYPDKPQGTQNV